MTIFDESSRYMITFKRLRGQGLRKLAAAWATGLLLMSLSQPTLAAWDIQQLMDALAQNKSGRATFVETKRLAMLDKPVESSGELWFTAPDRLEKRTIKPKPESLTVSAGEVLIERGTQKYRLQLESYPELAAFIVSVRGTLAGDRKALESVYRLNLEGSANRWTLHLQPLTQAMQATVRSIRIEGVQDQLVKIEIIQADGDSSLMVIEKKAAAQW
jgi:outer membrane lipoprotein-sorting protein